MAALLHGGYFFSPFLISALGEDPQPPDTSTEKIPFYYRDAAQEASCTIMPEKCRKASGTERWVHASGEVECV